MENALALAAIMGPFYLVFGLSILIYAKAWQRLLLKWREDHLPLFTIMFMTLILGLICIHFYNVWDWSVYLLVTITGWAAFLKGAFYFLMPGSVIKKVMSLGLYMWMIYVGAIVCLLFGLALSYYAYIY